MTAFGVIHCQSETLADQLNLDGFQGVKFPLRFFQQLSAFILQEHAGLAFNGRLRAGDKRLEFFDLGFRPFLDQSCDLFKVLRLDDIGGQSAF